MECATLRSFVTPKLSRARASNGLVAFGYAHCLVDENNPEVFYCGRKAASGEREHSSRAAKTGRALRHARFHGSCCSQTPIRAVQLIGRLLVFRAKTYGLCAFCGNFFCLYNAPSWKGALPWCGRCIVNDVKLYEVKACDWCGQEKRSSTLNSVWTSDRKQRFLCKTCSRPAFLNAPFKVDWKSICDDLTGVHKSKRR